MVRPSVVDLCDPVDGSGLDGGVGGEGRLSSHDSLSADDPIFTPPGPP